MTLSQWERIIIHCSASKWGSAAEIREWHMARGWIDGGYHYDILNGWAKPDYYLPALDGSIEVGRRIDGDIFVEGKEKGAHAYGFNSNSIGICLIGIDYFTPNQFSSLFALVSSLMKKFGIDAKDVQGHYELDTHKTCPNFDVGAFRTLLGATK